MKSKRNRTIALIVILLFSISALVFLGLKGNVIYYYDVTEAVTKSKAQGTDRFRIAGAVRIGSVSKKNNTVEFIVTDGGTNVKVIHRGDPPQLFKDSAPVVCEGSWKKGSEGKIFESDRILIKHGNEYKPPAVEQ
ncbi:MAG: cytochrome c maturation protein CcmE [Acidimicrobiia bacterium]|nr:cytochrome c maturation protein CcmE [Acidimicrobiia bacterium]